MSQQHSGPDGLLDMLFPFLMFFGPALPVVFGWARSDFWYAIAVLAPAIAMAYMLITARKHTQPLLAVWFGVVACLGSAPFAVWHDYVYRLKQPAMNAVYRPLTDSEVVWTILEHGNKSPWLLFPILLTFAILGVAYTIHEPMWVLDKFDEIKAWFTGKPPYTILNYGTKGNAKTFDIYNTNELYKAFPPGSLVLGERRNPVHKPGWLLNWEEFFGLSVVEQNYIKANKENTDPKVVKKVQALKNKADKIKKLRPLWNFLNFFTYPRRYRQGVCDLITLMPETHLLTVAGAGAGKSVSIAVPNLLTFKDGSCFVLDPKGELYAITSRHRAEKLGQRVFLMDPKNQEKTASYNPLDFIDANSATVVSDCGAVASWLMCSAPKKSGGSGNEQFFQDMARQLLTGLIMYVVCGGFWDHERNLTKVVQLLSVPDAELKKTLTDIFTGGYGQGASTTLVGALTDMPETAFGGVKSQAKSTLDWLSDPTLAALVNGQGERVFRTDDILKGDVTLYLCIDNQTLMQYAGVARVIIGSIMQSIMRAAGAAARGQGSKSKMVLMLLDEAARLGYFPPLQEALTLGRGAGIRAWPIYQDFGQLDEAFGTDGAKAFADSCDIKTYLVIKDNEGAKKMSEAIGNRTIRQRSVGLSNQASTHASRFSFLSSSPISPNFSEIEQPVFSPNEIRNLGPDVMIIEKGGYAPMIIGKARYFERPELKSFADENPYYNE